jgi:hypothetical protein
MDKFCSECGCHIFTYEDYFKHLVEIEEYSAADAHTEAIAVFPVDPRVK